MTSRETVQRAQCLGCHAEYSDCRAAFDAYAEPECCDYCVHVTADNQIVVWATGEVVA